MTALRNLMGSGVPAGTANAINGSVNSGLTAAGTTQATALNLLADINSFATVASGAGAILNPNTAPSDTALVYNGGSNALLVYPPLGMSINSGSANAGFSVATTKSAIFTAVSATQIIAVLSA